MILETDLNGISVSWKRQKNLTIELKKSFLKLLAYLKKYYLSFNLFFSNSKPREKFRI